MLNEEEDKLNISEEQLKEAQIVEQDAFPNNDPDRDLEKNEPYIIKPEENIINRIKVKVDIISDIYTEELFIAKRIATNFQLSRKYGGYHPYDSVRLIMDENEFTHIVIKYAEYINKITRTPIEITKEELPSYSYCKVFEIDGKPMKIYLI